MKPLMLALALVGPIQQIDDAARAWTQAQRTPGLEKTARFFTDIGKPQVVLGFLLGVCVLDNVAGVRTARLALIALAPTNLAVEGLKRATYRVRPDGEHERSNASFPSSHAANAFALATVLAWRWRRAAPICFALATLVAASRVWLDRHWLSDSLFGALLGLGIALLVLARLGKRPQETGPAPAKSSRTIPPPG